MSLAAQEIWRRGLLHEEAARRLAEHGPNTLPEAKGITLIQRLINQFKSPLIYILLFALAFDTGLWLWEGAQGVPHEAVAIALILALNAGLGAYQESKAEDSLARLKALAAPAVYVVRSGALVHVPATDLVPGDIMRIEAGDRIPADGTLLSGQGTMTDEAVLTGESLPVEKAIGDDMYSGTLMVRGMGYLEVTHTGPHSTMGKLATLIGGIEAGETPLERRLKTFGNQVAVAIMSLGVALIVGGLFAEGVDRIGHVILFAVALAVAAVPEGLPAVLTLTLAMGVERLAGRKAVVRRLSAVEALGSVTVIATDKTGTLTESRMQVRAVDSPDASRALQAMVLANDAEIATGAGDPLEVALLEHAADSGLDIGNLASQAPRMSSRPFDSDVKFMRVTVQDDGRHISYLKGAPEVVIARSALNELERAEWTRTAEDRAREGYRVLALAWSEGERDEGMTFLGLVSLWDPPRKEVPDAIARARSAGIRVLMITGDHPATAKAVGETIGITSPRAVTGAELDGLSREALIETVRTVNVFARVSPEHKLRIVEALKDAGEIVAVTGDGVNDAPALKRSDIGVSMGLRGSDVAREVSDIVLLDDNFATIVAAIEEGRSIYENIQKFIRFLFSTNFALVLLISGGLLLSFLSGIRDPLLGTFFLPLTAVQLLWINFIADGPPAIALAFDRNPDVMNKPPRPANARLLDEASLRFVVVSGLAKAGIGLGFLAVMPHMGHGLEETRTAVFLFESMAQLVFAYPSRHIGGTPAPNRWVHLAVWLGVGLQVLTVLLPPLRVLLGLVPISPLVFAAVAAAVLLTWAIAELLGHVAAPVARSSR